MKGDVNPVLHSGLNFVSMSEKRYDRKAIHKWQRSVA